MGYVNSPTLLAAGDIVFGAALVPAVLFLIVYTVTAPWWRSAIGRMFVIAQAAIVLVSIVVLLSLVLGTTYPGRDIVRLAGYSLHFVGQLVFLVTYLNTRRAPATSATLPRTRMDTRS